MLTRLTVRNFKRFDEVVVDLEGPVLLIGPNNSGKTTALQALALWDLGMRRWREKRSGRGPAQRSGVAVGRRDLFTVPVPDAKHLWRGLRVRQVRREEGKQRTSNIRVDILVEGREGSETWQAGLEFDYANAESFYCRPLRLSPDGKRRMAIPDAARKVRVAYLPPMSGLAAHELRLEPGGVNVRLGEGRTAEVLRNLCFRVHQENPEAWKRLAAAVEKAFGTHLEAPRYNPDRGEITMSYREDGIGLDLTAAGRGMQQTVLLLAHLALNPGSVLLLDEPDAHLEIVRQRETYDLLARTAEESGSQLIVASHSEVLLREAAGRDTVVAFVGRPHRVARRGSQVLKALRDIGYGDFEQARKAGFVLYVEGTTDLGVLRALAARIGNREAERALDSAFVRPVGNEPQQALRHFHGLREAWPQLRGAALFDRLDRSLPDSEGLPMMMWKRREIENYLCSRETLLRFAAASGETPAGSLFERDMGRRRRDAMRVTLEKMQEGLRMAGRAFDPWSPDTKVSDEFLQPLFRLFFRRLGEANRMPKRDFRRLAAHIPDANLDPEIARKLGRIAREYRRSAGPLDF